MLATWCNSLSGSILPDVAFPGRFVSAVFALTLLFYGCGHPPPRPETLPRVLTDQDFWKLITDFSEPEGYFPSDNFLSNESRYQEVFRRFSKP
jgi:hypothetical protein